MMCTTSILESLKRKNALVNFFDVEDLGSSYHMNIPANFLWIVQSNQVLCFVLIFNQIYVYVIVIST